MNGVQASYVNEDARLAFWMNQVKDVEFYRPGAQHGPKVSEVLMILE
jgi:hypothetical protein